LVWICGWIRVSVMIGNKLRFGGGVVGLYDFTSHTFTTLGSQGKSGPTSVAGYSGSDVDGYVSLSAGRQLWVVPMTGNYRVTVAGAQGGVGGGSAANYYGGGGGVIRATLSLVEGETLYLLVGQRGGSVCANRAAGGGGASVVANAQYSNVRMVAGGGSAGGGNTNPRNGIDALTWNGSNSGAGGGGSSNAGGGAGGGAYSNASGTTADTPDLNGIGYQSTMLGGFGGSCAASRDASCGLYVESSGSLDFGGFGGGGGGEWCASGAIGAGGGFTGGNGNASSDASAALTASTSYIEPSATTTTALTTNRSTTLSLGSSLNGYIIIEVI
jgi:hypothetical protein